MVGHLGLCYVEITSESKISANLDNEVLLHVHIIVQCESGDSPGQQSSKSDLGIWDDSI